MTNERHQTQQEPTTNKQGLSSEHLNLILAICAILISAASFYATYLQADAAERQVKAMTLPLIQFDHGNWDNQQQKPTLYFTLNNAGIGPAIIKTVEVKYQHNSYRNWMKLYQDCCLPENNPNKITVNAITNPVMNSIIAGQSELQFISIDKEKNDDAFWQKLNSERNQFTLSICYCSMLGECYLTEKNGVVEEVKQCPSQ